jgi:tRNA U34 5-methylaminomethyl-2-thiouridine-forming methyltransferase MnmC
VIEVRANRMPDGGLVTTFTDITPSVKAAEALERANATLERRVRERTGELTRLNSRARARQGRSRRRQCLEDALSSPPPATTSCSRSTPRGSTSPA